MNKNFITRFAQHIRWQQKIRAKQLQHGSAPPFAQGFPCFRSFSCSKDRISKLL